MAFDGLVTYSISQELINHIIGGKIDKIFEPNSNEILLGVYCNRIKYALDMVVSPNNYRICLTNSPKPNPTFAPNFCMVLRKHLLNTRIVSIKTFSLERIVMIEFEGRSKSDDLENKKLFFDSKTILQELVQGQSEDKISYHLIREEGPDHSKTFHVEVHVGDVCYGEGVGKNKKTAEQEAAYSAILKLREKI